MSPAVRKLALTAHVVCSVGWLGAVTAFFALAVAGLTSGDAQTVRASYLAMATIGWYVIVPLSWASLVTGIVQSLGTSWGLVRYYWVLVKLVMTVLATIVLLLHMQPVDELASLAAARTLTGSDLGAVRVQVVVDAAAALLVLLVAATLSVYKPRGMTPYGWRAQRRLRSGLAGELGQASSGTEP